MKILTSSRERALRSFLFANTGIVFLVIFLCSIFLEKAVAQDCNGVVINISGNTTGQWTAPTDQGPGPWSVQIEAVGASGGDQGGGGNQGGQGAQIIANFVVTNGQTILAISGAPGGTPGNSDAGGGGAGSGAVNCGNPTNCATGVILVVAAGGNGGENQGPGNGGSSLNGSPGGGGVGGGNGGGGMISDGLSGDNSGQNIGGGGGVQVSPFGLVPGGSGSEGSNDGGEGMGGGGGGGNSNSTGSGGGAGRSGGAGGNTSTVATSYVHPSATNVQPTNGAQGGGPFNGTVTVTCLGSLPIHLINFKAVILDEGVNLVWSTASEKDNHGYDVQRSADNRNWTTLGFVPGNGTTIEKSEYLFADEHPLSGVNYYRLKQMDTDGSFQHTPIVVADMHFNSLQFDIFPNPSTDGALTFRTVSRQDGDALLEIWDWAGYKVLNERQHLWEGTTVWPVSMANFPKGTYTVRLQMPDGTTEFRKIILQ